MNIRFFFILTIFFVLNCFSQDKAGYSIKLDRIGNPEILRLVSASKGLVLYDLDSPYFKDIKAKIKFPKHIDYKITDTAYTEITSKTSNCESIVRDKHILIFNAKSENPLLFVDNATAFDFSQSKLITLENPYIVNLLGKNLSTISYKINKRKKNEEVFPGFSFPMLKVPPLDISYWLIIQDSFIKAGDFTIGNTNFSLALYDANSNGIYNEQEDKILIDKYQQDYFLIFNNDIVSTSTIQTINTFETDGHYFQITKIEKDGSAIYFNEIRPTENVTIKKVDSLPKVTYITDNNETKNLRDNLQKGKYFYVEIWASYCPPCIRDIPVLNEINKLYPDKVAVLGLIDTKDMDELQKKINEFHIEYPQGFSNKIINMNLLLNGYPHGVLFDDSGKIVKYKMRAEELKKFMESQK